MLNKNQHDPLYLDRLIYQAKRDAQDYHPQVIWEFVKTAGHEVYISAKRAGGTILVRFRIEPKQLVGEDLKILLNKMAGFL